MSAPIVKVFTQPSFARETRKEEQAHSGASTLNPTRIISTRRVTSTSSLRATVG